MRKYTTPNKEIILGTIGKRIKEALELRDMKQIELSKTTGISKSALSQYISGRNDPKQDKIFIMANALGVNPLWLMGFDVPIESVETIDATKSERIMLSMYRQLDKSDKDKLFGFVNGLLSSEKYREKRNETVG